jgi:tetrahydromethanopterin S-methyltransferase subunit H
MFKFERDQMIFEIGSVKIGGQPGQLPPVMIGSIFYKGHKIVLDESKGVFDKIKAEKLLNEEAEVSDEYGLPRIIDVVGHTPEALIRFVEFVADKTDSPFLLDGVTADVRVQAAKYIAEVGLSSRAIYNSLDVNYKEEELTAIRESGMKNVVLQLFNPRDPTPRGRLKTLTGLSDKPGLLEAAKKAGAEKILVDVCVLDMPDIGLASQTIYNVKAETGLPTGCGPANAISLWKKVKDLQPEVLKCCDAISQALPIIMGANFILYGPISHAKYVYPACAVVSSYIAYNMRFKQVQIDRSHPLFKIFR